MEGDDATLETSVELLTCKQYVVLSTTFEVPTLYFTLHDASACIIQPDDLSHDTSYAGGSPLSLEEIMKSSLFRPQALPSADGNTFAVTLPESSFALFKLSQGDHPTLGTLPWYFHPCHTADVVGEILAEIELDRADELRWLEVWFKVMGNMVDLFAGSVA